MTSVRILNRILSLVSLARKSGTLDLARCPRANNSRDARNCRGRRCRAHALRAETSHVRSTYNMVSFTGATARR